MRLIVLIMMFVITSPISHAAEAEPTWQDLVDRLGRASENSRKQREHERLERLEDAQREDDRRHFLEDFDSTFDTKPTRDYFYDTPVLADDRIKTINPPKVPSHMDFSIYNNKPMSSEQIMRYQLSPNKKEKSDYNDFDRDKPKSSKQIMQDHLSPR